MGPLNREKRTRSVDMLLEAVCKSWLILSGTIFPLISVVLVCCSLICLIAPVILASDSNTLLNHLSSKLLPTWQRQRVYGLLTVTQFGADVIGASQFLQMMNQSVIILVWILFILHNAVTLHFFFFFLLLPFLLPGHIAHCLEHLSVLRHSHFEVWCW